MVEVAVPVGEGSWFAYTAPKPAAVTSWLLPRKDSKKVARLISAVSASWEDDAPIADLAASLGAGSLTPPAVLVGTPAAGANGGAAGSLGRQGSLTRPSPLTRQPSLSSTQSFVFPSGGLTVKQGLTEVASGLYRVTPFVHCAPDNSAVVAFQGHLLNLQELAHRYPSPAGTPKRPGAPGDANNAPTPTAAVAALAAAAAGLGGGGAGGGAGGLARQGSIERSLDIGALTARVVLSMYQAEGNELVLLSELQGSYAFVIYDAAGRHAFAARDPSGAETLFYRIGDDGSAAFASSRAAIPEAAPGDDAAAGPWRELPPGHYISGRSPKLHQYALTPEQLQVRELCEELGPRAAYEKRRSSLDNNGRRGAAADADFDFGMDI